jgi:hypothetical protein
LRPRRCSSCRCCARDTTPFCRCAHRCCDL